MEFSHKDYIYKGLLFPYSYAAHFMHKIPTLPICIISIYDNHVESGNCI